MELPLQETLAIGTLGEAAEALNLHQIYKEQTSLPAVSKGKSRNAFEIQ